MTQEKPDRPAVPDDVDEIAGALPETVRGTSWGDVPTWLVPREQVGSRKPRGFVLYRRPRHDAVDPATGEEYDDLLVVHVADATAKEELVQGPGPFFTIDHFRGYNAVLVQRSRLGEISRAELAEVITDAWLAVAPPALARQHRAG